MVTISGNTTHSTWNQFHFGSNTTLYLKSVSFRTWAVSHFSIFTAFLVLISMKSAGKCGIWKADWMNMIQWYHAKKILSGSNLESKVAMRLDLHHQCTSLGVWYGENLKFLVSNELVGPILLLVVESIFLSSLYNWGMNNFPAT